MPRALGPYQHGARWRVILVGDDGRRTHARESDDGPSGFASKESAELYIAAFTDAAHGRTIADAVDEYLAVTRGRKASTITTSRFRLRALLRLDEAQACNRLLRNLTAAVAQQLAEQRLAEIASETMRGELRAAGQFASWCVDKGWLPRDPFAGVELELGPRSRGKKQLRIDEARKFVDAALGEGDERGIAAAMAFLMDLRASEIIQRQVRDVDDGGAVLWIDRTKTRAGDRKLEIPQDLREPLARLCAGRGGDEMLFPGRSRHWVGYHVRRLCGFAKVPVVCPHGLRGTHASIAVREVSIEHVARALGHASPEVTRRHYLAPGAERQGRQRAALRVLSGGRK